MKKTFLACLIGTIALVSVNANAADANVGPYIGVGVGQSTYKIDDSAFAATASTRSHSFKPVGAKFFGGYEFSANLAVEAGYAALGTAKASYTYAAGSPVVVDGKTNAFYVAVKGTAPLNDAFGIYGKLGATSNHSSASVPNLFKNKSGLLAAIGADYNVSKDVAVGLDYTSYGKIDDRENKVSAFSLNVRCNF